MAFKSVPSSLKNAAVVKSPSSGYILRSPSSASMAAVGLRPSRKAQREHDFEGQSPTSCAEPTHSRQYWRWAFDGLDELLFIGPPPHSERRCARLPRH